MENVLLVAASASGALLLAAHLFEWFGGLEPCPLCLDQRQAHWAALAMALAGLLASTLLRARLVASAAVGATALIFLASTGLALYHT
ncbi:MAG: disulfide bond formation protein B, partial [Parvularculaceae bacterium]|nr:disulfide bond formation protein B [Parvularculaceae bacterium]